MHSQYLPIARTSDEKIEVAHVSRFRDYIAIRTRPPDDPPGSVHSLKYWPRSGRAGDEGAGTAVGTVPIYTPTSPTTKVYHAQNYPSVWRIASNYLSWFTLGSGISIRVRKDADRNGRGLPKRKEYCLRGNRNSRLTLFR